jgi:hypothetical protein
MPARPLLLLCLLALPCRADGLRAGAAKADITPPVGGPLWGYAARRDSPSTGVLDPLHARALVLEAGKTRLALVALDLGRAPPRAWTAGLRARVKKSAGIDPVLLVASHTHHGPVLEVDSWPTPKTSYVRRLEEKLGDLVLAAAKDLRPARLGVAARLVRRNRNRHSRRADAPVDRELLVLRVEDAGGKAIAHAVNFAAHPTLLPAALHKLSADYVGVLCALVEKETKAPCLFLQGAAGDLSPDRSGGLDTPARFGAALAADALALAKTVRCDKIEAPGLPFREDSFRFTPRVDLGDPLWRIGLSAAFYPALLSFYRREYADGVRPLLTTAVLDGRIGLVGVSGEFFCGHALALKRRARLGHLLFLGYCNDYHQYFPTIEAATEGGYGTERYVGTAEVGAGERVMDRALVRLYQLRGALKDEGGRRKDE